MDPSSPHATPGDTKDDRRRKMKQKRSFSNLFAKSSSFIMSPRASLPDEYTPSETRTSRGHSDYNTIRRAPRPPVPHLDLTRTAHRSCSDTVSLPATPRLRSTKDGAQDYYSREAQPAMPHPASAGGRSSSAARRSTAAGEEIPAVPRPSSSTSASAPTPASASRSQPPSPSPRRSSLKTREGGRSRTLSRAQQEHDMSSSLPSSHASALASSRPLKEAHAFPVEDKRRQRRPTTADGASKDENADGRGKRPIRDLPPLPPLPPQTTTSLGSRVTPPKPLIIPPYHHRTRSMPTTSPPPTRKSHNHAHAPIPASVSSPQLPLGMSESPVVSVHPPLPHLNVSVATPPSHSTVNLSRPSSTYSSSDIDHRSVDSSITSPLPTSPLPDLGDSPLSAQTSDVPSKGSSSRLTVDSARSRSHRISRGGPKPSATVQAWSPPANWSGPLPSEPEVDRDSASAEATMLSKLMRLRKQKSSPKIDKADTKAFFNQLNMSSPSMWHPLPKRRVATESEVQRYTGDAVPQAPALQDVMVTVQDEESDGMQVQAMSDVIPRLRELKSSRSWLRGW
ncbi:hypothetical protein BJ138DRAFT_1129031 [Hygrophoropsis aurantiaca]|uniref:Uncharacterized protein n=1 Tax=Hygrophoropsis aurantiaca TaxID=72124 RepID=A0ACB8A2Q6_9AGAM|nr:hypothetical protein BJ138DRAFT_1129031 [Hygrophoropsis aurantiaca]